MLSNQVVPESMVPSDVETLTELSSSPNEIKIDNSPVTDGDDTSNMDTRMHQNKKSSVGGAVFNFTNCIIGAGAIGLGGAIAQSGGLISVAAILFFAILTKLSLDLVVVLSVNTEGAKNSYEDLGYVAYGKVGRAAVLVSKSLYSFGCLVAYIVVVKDNFASAARHLIFGDATGDHQSWVFQLLLKDNWVAFFLSVTVILPLCLLRDMSPLSNLSAISVCSMVAIVSIVIYLYAANPNGEIRQHGGTVYENWIEIRPGVLESLGTFVFTFVSQHTVHLAYESLRPDVRCIKNWKRVSTLSILISTCVSLSVGLFVYMSFWETAQSDLFNMYPPLASIDIAKILLCVTMLLTFPLPFFTVREMIILAVSYARHDESEVDDSMSDLRESLLPTEGEHSVEAASSGGDSVEHEISSQSHDQSWWLLPGEEKQLTITYHVGLTVVLWGLTTCLAIAAPSLGDVLDLVGCATGTVIAFILPALFSFKLCGYTHLAALILTVGGAVGLVGTIFSTKKLLADVF